MTYVICQMSRLTTKAITKKELYKDFNSKLKRGENQEAVLRDITETCESCRPLNPIMCVESCPIWTLKRKYRDAFEDLAEKPSLTDLLRLSKNERRLKILERLHEKPSSLEELREHLKNAGYPHSLNILHHHYVKPLADVSFIEEQNGVYAITLKGKSIFNLLNTSEITKLSTHSQGYDEKILKDLLSGPKTYEDLREVASIGSLRRSLRRLQKSNFLVKPTQNGRIFYFATKKRATRKLSLTEMKIFKSLPPEGLSAKDLSEKVGISMRRVYKYLKQLKYKRHVRKEEKTTVYRLTDAGKSLAQSIKLAYNIIQT
jgi:predicted transcriptional regulator